VTARGLSARLRPNELGRRSPPAAWEAYFLIGIFPPPAPVLWCKVQLFSGRRPGRHSLSAIEGMDGGPEKLVLVGTEDAVTEHRSPAGFSAQPDRWDVRADGLRWTGDFPALRLEIDEPRLSAATATHEVLRWIRVPRVLTYWTAFGMLTLTGDAGIAAGVGLVEHAWGADTRADPLRASPRAWQWDVLAFDDGSACAGLSVGGRPALRSGGRVPGESFATGWGSRIRVRERDEANAPIAWDGALSLGKGRFRYRARATTPVATVVPQGGYRGFAFDGEWTHRSSARRLAGNGFTEFRHATRS